MAAGADSWRPAELLSRGSWQLSQLDRSSPVGAGRVRREETAIEESERGDTRVRRGESEGERGEC